jgi:succinate dehydrogenase / fumarate reductase, iron-sulfur subunit
MADYTLRIRRFSPETGEAPYWQDYQVDMDGHRSVLDGILQVKDREDGSIGIRCSCRAAICGSCGVRINGRPNLACHTHLDKAAETATDGVITVEPMGNMPVLKDLIVDMDAVHWKKIQRVTPWLLPDGPEPEREYIVEPESMIDVTQSMACIQCGACVSDCLSMEVDPLFIGPAALAKAYRFVGDPRDGQQFQRLKDLAEDPHGIYDCTHCFNCIEACPKGVAPMSQIMRLRRVANSDHHIVDRNNGHRHERAFVRNIERNGWLHEADLLPDSYGGKFHPRAVPELARSLPAILTALQRRKVTPAKALLHPHKAPDDVKRIYKHVHGKRERFELNLYVVGKEDDDAGPPEGVAAGRDASPQHSSSAAHTPAERSPNR